MTEREAFEEKMCHKLVGVFDNDLNCYTELTDQLMWEAWQAAKSQSIPEGFVFVPKEPTLLMQRAGCAEAIKPSLSIVSSRNIYKAMIETWEQSQ